jgi:hypothetical protein
MANKLNVDLKDKFVRIDTTSHYMFHQYGWARGGFGCNPAAMGTAVFLEYPDGTSTRVEGYDVAEIIPDTEVQDILNKLPWDSKLNVTRNNLGKDYRRVVGDAQRLADVTERMPEEMREAVVQLGRIADPVHLLQSCATYLRSLPMEWQPDEEWLKPVDAAIALFTGEE